MIYLSNLLKQNGKLGVSCLLAGLILFSGCSSQTNFKSDDIKTLDQFQAERSNIEAATGFQESAVLNEKEMLLDQKLQNLITDYSNSTTDSNYIPGNQFYYFNSSGDNSISSNEIYRIVSQMPKGSNLHSHSTAALMAEKIYDLALESDDFYIYCGNDHSKYLEAQIYVSDKKESVPEGFELFKSAIDENKITKDRVLSLWRIDEEDETVEHIWDEFGRCFARIEGSSKFLEKYYQKFFESALLECIEDNVMHLELRSGLVKFNDDETGLESLKLLRDTYYKVKQQHPDFTMKVILTYSKSKSKSLDSVEIFLNNAYNLKQELKDEFDPNNIKEFIIGFDLVNEEDAGYSLQEYAPYILDMRQKGMALDPYLHAGESNLPTSSNIIDAYVLGTKRIGHGLNLYKFPELLENVKKDGIALEVCPISNQLLRYVTDLRTHPGYEYLKRGVPIVICSDDTTLLGNPGLSYDFFEVAIAWNLSLKELKQLCMNSIIYSGCTQEEKNIMMKNWESDWAQFVDANV